MLERIEDARFEALTALFVQVQQRSGRQRRQPAGGDGPVGGEDDGTAGGRSPHDVQRAAQEELGEPGRDNRRGAQRLGLGLGGAREDDDRGAILGSFHHVEVGTPARGPGFRSLTRLTGAEKMEMTKLVSNRSKRLAPATLWLTLVACDDRAFIELPQVPGAATVVAFFRTPGELRVEARENSGAVRFELERGEGGELVLAFYESTLAALEIPAGPVPAATAETCLAGGFGEPERAYASSLEDPELVSIEALPGFVTSFRFERPCPCAELSWRTVPISSSLGISSLAAGGPDSVFYLMYKHRLTEVNIDTGAETIMPLEQAQEYVRMCATEPGTVYLAGTNYTFARFRRGGAIESLPSFPGEDAAEPTRMSCEARGDGVEVLLTRAGDSALLRFDGSEWTTAYVPPTPSMKTGNRGALLRLRDGSIFMVPDDGGVLVDLDTSLRTLKVTPWMMDLDPQTGPFGGATETLDLGVVMHTRAYQILHRAQREAAWGPVAGDDEGAAPSPEGIVPFGRGALTFGDDTSIREIHPLVGRCAPVSTPAHLLFRRSVVLEPSGRLVLGPGREVDGDPALLVIEPRP